MQRAIRMLILMVGLAGAYVAVAAPMLPAPDGGPIPTCRRIVGIQSEPRSRLKAGLVKCWRSNVAKKPG